MAKRRRQHRRPGRGNAGTRPTGRQQPLLTNRSTADVRTTRTPAADCWRQQRDRHRPEPQEARAACLLEQLQARLRETCQGNHRPQVPNRSSEGITMSAAAQACQTGISAQVGESRGSTQRRGEPDSFSPARPKQGVFRQHGFGSRIAATKAQGTDGRTQPARCGIRDCAISFDQSTHMTRPMPSTLTESLRASLMKMSSRGDRYFCSSFLTANPCCPRSRHETMEGIVPAVKLEPLGPAWPGNRRTIGHAARAISARRRHCCVGTGENRSERLNRFRRTRSREARRARWLMTSAWP